MHVVDARTFETEEIVRVPTLPKRPATVATPRESQHTRRTHRQASTTYLTPSSAIPHYNRNSPIVLALQDTFRISGPSSPAFGNSSQGLGDRASETRQDDEDDSDLVVIPPLGDSGVEHDVQTLLGRHGIRARRYSWRDGGPIDEQEGEEEQDTEQEENDCVESLAPSRSSSPSPSVPPQSVGVAGEEPDLDDLDIAGTCFDPTGAYVYVATKHSVAEWSVRGADKQWWLDDSWAR